MESEKQVISTIQVLYAAHNADHADLNAKQRLSIQHYRENLNRLGGRRDSYRKHVLSIPLSPLGLNRRADADQQEILYDKAQAFCDQVYTTVSSLASVFSRVRLIPDIPEPPLRSMDKFIDWWAKLPGFDGQPMAAENVKAARDYRTLAQHPQQFPVFDWSTSSVGLDDIHVVLLGDESSSGRVPPGSERNPDGDGRWAFVSPDMDAVIYEFWDINNRAFGPLPDIYPLAPGKEYCRWEAEGHGSTLGVVAAQELMRQVSSMSSAEAERLETNFSDDLASYLIEARQLPGAPIG